jgi:outer membrane receptor for ferric coprogen and ferric-rhodotorulic acid
MWGALILAYSDGTQAEFGRSASTSVDWTFWDTRNTTAFAEYTFRLAEAWDFKLTYNYRKYEDDSKLFFAYSTTGIDRDTGLGLWGWPGNWVTDDESNLFESSLNGTFELFGREHEALVGVAYVTGKHKQYNREADPNDPAWGELAPFPYAGNSVGEPAWGPLQYYGTTDQTIKRGFGATRFSLTDKLRAIVGFNYAEYHRDGDQTGVAFDQTESGVSPYAGLTYQLLDQVMLYGSYSDIYQPQDQFDIDNRYLEASKGLNYEVGVKAEWLERRLLTTVALFKAEQEDLATFAGVTDDAQYYYKGVDVDSKGIELEVVGRLGQNVDLTLGYTTLQLEGAEGQDIYEWVPRHTANIALSARIPTFTALSLGISGRWQSETSKLDEYTNLIVRQDSYATLNAFARWDVTQKLHVRANVYNFSDEKYITSLYQIGYYGAPRSYEVGLGYKF